MLSDPSLYRSITGALQYLTLTHPDLSFVVNQACQHMHNPKAAHFVTLKHILKYIKGTLSFHQRASAVNRRLGRRPY